MKDSTGWIIALSLFLAGIAIAYAVTKGLANIASSNNHLADVVSQKVFASPASFTAVPDNVVPLSGDSFAVVNNTTISVYHVNEQGKVSRSDDADIRLEPIRRRHRDTKYSGE